MPLPFIRNITKLWNSSQYYGTWYIKQNFKLNLLQWKAYLCSRKVAWISHTRTKDLKFFNSVQISDIWTLPMLWASSRNLDAYKRNEDLMKCKPHSHTKIKSVTFYQDYRIYLLNSQKCSWIWGEGAGNDFFFLTISNGEMHSFKNPPLRLLEKTVFSVSW